MYAFFVFNNKKSFSCDKCILGEDISTNKKISIRQLIIKIITIENNQPEILKSCCPMDIAYIVSIRWNIIVNPIKNDKISADKLTLAAYFKTNHKNITKIVYKGTKYGDNAIKVLTLSTFTLP